MTSAISGTTRRAIAIVGGGPRGVSLLERIGANLTGTDHPGLDIHIVDDTQIGAGRVWRTDQDRELCMNTLAHAVTLFPDPSVTMDGPVVAGPTLHEWSLLLLGGPRAQDVPPAHRAAFDAVPVREGIADDFRTEIVEQRPESHPSRALYGEYISWVYAHARRALPASVTLTEHTGRVVAIDDNDGRQTLTLGDGASFTADAIVAATGWIPRAETAEERTISAAVAENPELVWVRPDSPVDQDLDAVPAGANAVVRGLGMGFFDAMALLTIGRGGRFVPDANADGGLRYEASGQEPVLHVSSRRGVPFRAKSLHGSLPPRATLRHLRAVDWDRVTRPIDVDTVIWPLILKDAFADWADALARVRPGAIDVVAAQDSIRDLDLGTRTGPLFDRTRHIASLLSEAVSPHLASGEEPLDLIAAAYPGQGRTWSSPADVDRWIADFVTHDLAEAERGADSPVKAALWAISAARGFTSRVGTFGGFTAESRASAYRELMSVGAMAGSGPPAFRNRQLLALQAAGLVHFIGPAARLTVTAEGFRSVSDAVDGSRITSSVLIDAWMHSHDVRESADPLVHQLTEAGRIRPFRAASSASGYRTTAAFDVRPSSGRAVRADGSDDPALHIAGIPIEEAMHDSIISPMPGSDPTMLRETDRVARSLIAVATSNTLSPSGAHA
ncbi:FAD/NAD(P)-binding protein [Microbacterium amylolyticum]|uniref:NAD(P)/FAD-binding protein YdhS n=1 Tax=Microbacterium amylolyticum TaxID=936337 RepID=A0ABS4ZHN5_9MICO|nr:FAD/NAD(P)-binding protein [Microbacterium amylolyticum]MBP2436523.1 putative NAD(P)/FAD-binding protein YdhS [Microbacterium amylolyticum]